MSLHAYGKNILLAEIAKEKKDGLLIVPDQNENHIKAKIMSLGNQVDEFLSEGDVVLMLKYGYHHLEHEGEIYLLAKEENIIGWIADLD